MELTIAGVGTRLGGRWVVDGVDATPPPGKVTGLLGPNGAGKTTLLRLIAGLLPAEAGAVLVSDGAEAGGDGRGAAGAAGGDGAGVAGGTGGNGRGVAGGNGADAAGGNGAGAGGHRRPAVPVTSIPRRLRARRIALLEQESSAAVPLLVREVVALGRVPYRSWWGADPDDGAVDRALLVAGAAHLADRTWDSLSGGERQRVHVARALAQEPDLLLLDEPTNHLDVSAQLSLLTFVRTLGVTTVAALHDLNLAATFCDHVLVLSQGRLAAAGAPADVLTPALLRAVYGVEADVLAHPATGRPVIAFSGVSGPRPADDGLDGAEARDWTSERDDAGERDGAGEHEDAREHDGIGKRDDARERGGTNWHDDAAGTDAATADVTTSRRR